MSCSVEIVILTAGKYIFDHTCVPGVSWKNCGNFIHIIFSFPILDLNSIPIDLEGVSLLAKVLDGSKKWKRRAGTA